MDAHVAHGAVAGLGAVHPPGRRRPLVGPARAEPARVEWKTRPRVPRLHDRVEALHRRGVPPVEAGHRDAAGARRRVRHRPRLGRVTWRAASRRARGRRRETSGRNRVVERRESRSPRSRAAPRRASVPSARKRGVRRTGRPPFAALLIALADGHHLAAVGLERGDVGAAEAKPDDTDGRVLCAHGGIVLGVPPPSKTTRQLSSAPHAATRNGTR